MSTRADYTHGIYQIESGRVVALRDLGEGRATTITADAEAVVADLLERGILKRGDRVVYRDTLGTWDELKLTNELRFAGFHYLGGRTIADVLAKLEAA